MVLNITFGNQIQNYNCGSDCCICTENIERDGMCNLKCSHSFHIECIDKWLATQENSYSRVNCPYCRSIISESEQQIISKLALIRKRLL